MGGDGVFRKIASELMPAVMLDKMGVGVVFLQGNNGLPCFYRNESAVKLLELRGDIGDICASELFSCLREQDRLSLEMMITNSMTSLKFAEISCRRKDGMWLMIKALPLAAKPDSDGTVYVTICDITGIRETDLENELSRKKLIILSDLKRLPTYEVDRETHTLTLSRELRKLYKCRKECMDGIVADVPDSCRKCGYCFSRESIGTYCAMYDDFYSGKTEGSAVIEVRKRFNDDFIPVNITWKSVADDKGHPVKALGIVEPVFNFKSEEQKTADELNVKLSLQDICFRRSEEYLKALRKYRHDRKNYIIALTAFLKEGRVDDALAFLGRMDDEFRQSVPLVSTGNPSIDAIVSDKLGTAIELGVRVTQTVGLSPDLQFDIMDLCLAVGCCLDNALEAVEKVIAAGGKPSIEFKLIERKNVIVMKMINSCLPSDDEAPDCETTKPDRINHGFGLQNIRRIVEKYGGYLTLTSNNNRFTTAFTLFI